VRLGTIRTASGTSAVRIDGEQAIECGARDVGALLVAADWRAQADAADGPRHATANLSYAPVVPRPGKIICVGLNYRTHITEMGRDLPAYPTLFSKYPEALIGALDPLMLPAESDQVDWEVELAVVLGRRVRRAGAAEAAEAIAGYSIINDVTLRDWQFRTTEWLQGKTFEATAPFGPHLVTPDEVAPDAKISCLIDGEVVQDSTIADLLFGPVDLVSYISTILTLDPGDVIATGTMGGVGHARTPPRYLQSGETLVARIEGIGELTNQVGRAAETGVRR
jgi:acylpyruvate hydrolase